MRPEPRVLTLALLVFALLLSACGKEPTSPAGALPGADALTGWTPADETRIYDRENIYDLVNGQAEAFFAYGFEQVAVGRYQNAEGNDLRVAVWQLATPADAYGLFTSSTSGQPAAMGNDGDIDPGRRLAFWQDRYYVHVRAQKTLPDDTDLYAFAQAVASSLPAGGERPALLDRLPSKGFVERSELFFHEEISIQDQVWLGGENLLGLGPQTDGILARYDVGGGVVRLLLIQYPDAAAAQAGLESLEADQALPEQSRTVGGLVTTGARDDLLGAVFGEVDEVAAGELLEEALTGK